MTFQDLNITTPLRNALEDIGINTPTPIQEESFSTIMSGKDMVGIAQTGTGKTFAYMLPILRMLKYSEQKNPRVLVLVPTRELVVQVVEEIKKLTAYMNVRIAGIYGGVNMNTQHQSLLQGQDIVVATPGRLYDLVLRRALQLKSIQKLVIDEVDVMLDLGFKFQINNIFELLPQNRQNIMFSATITENVENLIEANFKSPQTISVAASGTPLDNIKQTGYKIPNFYTKVNLLRHILADKETYSKVLIFVAYKRMADRLYTELEQYFQDECTVIHSNKTQNYRLRSIKQFGSGFCRILVATDVMARGLDIESVSHVINFDTPKYPENYMHRIGRTGRAEKEGNSILMTTEAEMESLEKIEALMKMQVPQEELPAEIEISSELIPEEQPKVFEINNPGKNKEENAPGPAFHEKKEKNRKENLGGSYRREIAKKYKKPKTRGDKNANRRKKK
ncbi:DEAD/DEAH box helicase [Salegentibacter mishustinae]|uniref:DEAD/DEAH box helicase n=1 Tax=Salegentibacter mishustinae TaxID=270918 RepID=A0A0Q9Z7Z7_9FLAO|nr:DEAD/DEAH box helicase [Salegentibacter mishustinae]KRG29046.1 DEAD/DEAH box helicase [Salegentibacter mishustinae]PNW21902.1 DEAD/DEAH box helicase [Salegentibacter mishustinae]PZX65250.1 ATP-dependent RNA helicase RhlE [Salegentibacter mishustinae]GGW86343.1 DEAD/DEAH box helicase [Salegentibacter mishustinae]